MHRYAQILGAAAIATLAAACSTTTPHGSAPTSPAVTPPVVSVTPTDVPVDTSASPPPASASPTHPAPTDLTIAADRIGPLKIGMSLTAAKATGLIVVNAPGDTAFAEGCTAAHWKGQPTDAWMVFNGKYGLRALDSFGNQQTPEGIRTGSTLAAVRRAYPHLVWRLDGDEIPDAKRTDGDAMIDVAKGDGAHYRINIQKSKVTEVSLESDRSGCYE